MASVGRGAVEAENEESSVRPAAGRQTWLSLTGGILLVGCFVMPALATPADMDQLPVVAPFECLLCHVQANPTPASNELNVFGLDFLNNGRIWNTTLANLDSDGDGCLNGIELGDATGDGFADGNVTSLETNPGDPTDCGNLIIDARTWGALKAIFDRR
jgi:hypothetical protein